MMFWLKQSTAVTVKMGPFLDSTDGNTVEDALTISQADIRVSKNGGAYAQTNNAAGATHDENGNYGVPLDTTDTATLGAVRVHIHESGALPVWDEFMVLPANVWDSLFGADTLEVDAKAILGTALTETSAGYLAAAFKKLFDVASPTLVASDVMRGTDSASTHTAANVWAAGGRELSTPADYKADVSNLDATVSSRSDGTGVTLHSDYDAAKTAAQAGDSMDVLSISGDATAANNLELQYDTTGLSGETFPATQAQIGNLASGSSSIGKNASAFTLTTGLNEVNTYAVTDEENGVYHTFEDNGGTSEAFYQFDVGGNGVGGSVEWVGYAQSKDDNWGLYVYDWVAPGWKQLGSVKPEDGIKIKRETVTLTTAHTGTGANLGLVRFRAYSTDGTLFATDRILCNLAIVSDSGDGAIWVDTLAGVAGTEKNVNGIPNNPVLTWADALTLAAAQGVDNFHISNGSTIQLSANSDYYSFQGHNWILDLNGQSIVSMYVEHANIYGTGTGINYRFISCKIALLAAISLHPGGMQDCGIGAEGITLALAGSYSMDGCFAMTSGASAPTIDFEAADEDKAISISNWQGDIEFEHFGNATNTHSALVSGVGHGTFNANCNAATAGDTLDAHGMWVVVDSVAGSWQGTFTVDGNVISLINTVDGIVDTILVDTNDLQTNQGSWATAVGFATAGDAMTLETDAITAAVIATDAIDADAIKADAITDIQSGLSTHAAADVWSVSTRTLTSFGSLVADIATAVWAAATRTLTAFGFEVTTDSASRTASKADVSALATSLELSTLESHGDSNWATAAGFSTHDAAAVVSALEAATSYKVIYAQAAGNVTGNVAGTEFTIKDPGTATTRLSIVWNDTDRTVTVS